MAIYMGTKLPTLLDRHEPLKGSLQTQKSVQCATVLVRNTLHYSIYVFNRITMLAKKCVSAVLKYLFQLLVWNDLNCRNIFQ